MLIGKSFHTLDDKDRLVIPSKFRKDFLVDGEGQCVIAGGNGTFLIIHTMASWDTRQRRIASLPTTDEEALFYRIKIIGEAEFCTLDRQGRVPLSQDHKRHARLGKDVILFGQTTSVWLWNKETWECMEAEHGPHFQSYATRWGV